MTIEFVALVMFAWEIWQIIKLDLKYSRDTDELMDGWEQKLPRMSLEDIIRLRHHSIMAWLTLCIMTMGRLFR